MSGIVNPGLGVSDIQVRHLGVVDYESTRQQMRTFTDRRRDGATKDEFWFLEHPPVYTLGQAGRREHLLSPALDIPVVQSDRGGQVTYHGPGQLVVYLLLDLRRLRLGVKHLVYRIEGALIELLNTADIDAQRHPGAPGVYVSGRKIAALGLRVRHQCTYHGLALNVEMDTTPFQHIDPCGYPGLEVTQLSELGVPWSVEQTAKRLEPLLRTHLVRRQA